jgi:arylsulfatase A-like enzyme
VTPSRPVSRRSFLHLLGSTVVAASACRRAAPRPPSVVLVLIDQLRKDAADRWLTKLNALAAGGVVFDRMRSVAPWTYPSVVSLASGLYPQQHGADGHLHAGILSHFDAEVPLLHRVAQAAGYRTAAFVTNPFLHTWNAFHQGFDHYDVSFVNSQENLRGLSNVVWNPERMFGDTVNRAVRDHFARAGAAERPELTYIHYIDVHGPWSGAPFSGGYEGAVRFLDERIVELHQLFLDRYDGNLLFLVTSDHGTAFPGDVDAGDGPALRRDKASVHDFNLRIPCFFLPSRLVTAPRRLAAPCGNVDVAPTLSEWLGVAMPLRMPGRSLMPAIRGDAAAEPAPLYARMSAFGSLSDCLVVGARKYIRHFDVDTGAVSALRVFDLDADPDELAPLAEDFGAVAEAIDREAGSHGVAFRPRFKNPPKDLVEKLRSMGYLQ